LKMHERYTFPIQQRKTKTNSILNENEEIFL
jgi:hypothetical protein